jgi:Tetrahydrofolate dehydrogenase/cyclohydrolase, catalytic domain
VRIIIGVLLFFVVLCFGWTFELVGLDFTRMIDLSFFRLLNPSSYRKMAKLIDGKQIAADIRGELKTQIIEWVAEGNRAPQLTAILIGDDAASSTYVNNKMKVGTCAPIDPYHKSIFDRNGCDLFTAQDQHNLSLPG